MAIHEVGSAKPHELTAAVTEYLQDSVEGTRAEIARSMGRHTSEIGSVLFRMNHHCPRHGKRIRVARYVYDDEDDARRYPRAVYVLGSGADAKKPARESDATYTSRYRNKRKGRVNSIFALAQGQFAPSAVRK